MLYYCTILYYNYTVLHYEICSLLRMKFALRGLADSLRCELSGFGIRVAICYPPDTDTPGFLQRNKTIAYISINT